MFHRACPRCHKRLPATARFCRRCGRELGEPLLGHLTGAGPIYQAMFSHSAIPPYSILPAQPPARQQGAARPPRRCGDASHRVPRCTPCDDVWMWAMLFLLILAGRAVFHSAQPAHPAHPARPAIDPPAHVVPARAIPEPPPYRTAPSRGWTPAPPWPCPPPGP